MEPLVLQKLYMFHLMMVLVYPQLKLDLGMGLRGWGFRASVLSLVRLHRSRRGCVVDSVYMVVRGRSFVCERDMVRMKASCHFFVICHLKA